MKKKFMEKKYTNLANKLVACRWIDITSYDVDNLDNFVDSKEYAHQSYIFITLGKFVGEDDTVIVISPSFTEKNSYIKQRKASIYAIPKKCILKIAELDFVGCEENKGKSNIDEEISSDRVQHNNSDTQQGEQPRLLPHGSYDADLFP